MKFAEIDEKIFSVAQYPLAILGIGIPGCGKTTALKPLAEARGFTYINRDDIREELTGDPANHSREKLVNQLMVERIVASMQYSKGVVVDMTHSRAKDRRTSIQICRNNGAQQAIGIWFDIPIEVCRKRNAGRSRIVREAALFTMQHRLKANPPAEEEGFDTIIRITE